MTASENGAKTAFALSLDSTLDKLKGLIPANELIEPLVMLAVVKKIEPDIFHEIFKQPIVSQKQKLNELVKESKLLCDFDFDILTRESFSANALQTLIYYVNDLESMSDFADLVYSAYNSISGRHGGEVISSDALSQVIKSFVGDVSESTIFDGAAGLSFIESGLDSKVFFLQDISISARNIGQSLLTLKGKCFEYTLGDSLVSSKFSSSADWVIMQPPWGMRLHADALLKIMDSKFLAFGKGDKLPSSASDALWIQFALFNANESGRVILVLPHGWTFRGGYDAKLRKYLLDNDLIESLVALPGGIHNFTQIPSMILVLNKDKNENQQGCVNFIDASDLGVRAKRNFHLPQADLDLLVSLMRCEKEHDLLKRVLLPEIYQNNYNLNIKQYFAETQEVVFPDYREEKEKLGELQQAAQSAQKKLLQILP